MSSVTESDDDQDPCHHSDEVSAVETTPIGKGTALLPNISLRRHHLTSDERATLLVEYVKLGTKPAHGAVQTLCDTFGVKRNYPAKLKRRYDRSMAISGSHVFQRKSGSGRKTLITPEMGEILAEWARTELYEFTYLSAADFLGVNRSTVTRFMTTVGWRSVLKGVRPFLSDDHMAARVEWANEHRRNLFQDWVDIDEKWFFTHSTGLRLKVPPGVTPPKRGVQGRSHIPKVMALVAVARPRPEYDFNGFIGAFRVGETYVAKRSSKNHQKGDRYHKDKSMDSELFIDMMISKVFRSIYRKMTWATEIAVQLDNAPGHASAATWEALNASLATSNVRNGRNIRLIFQPAKSPDTNVLDLAVFPSLSKRVSKLNKFGELADLDGLWNNIQKALDEYPPEILDKAFDTKIAVMKAIKAANGANDFKLPHSKK